MKRYCILYLCIFYILVSCGKESDVNNDTNKLKVELKDTLNLSNLAYELHDLEQRYLKTKIVNYKNELIESVGQVDTFYLKINYVGKELTLRKHQDFQINDLSNNLRYLGKDRQGRFKFYIDTDMDFESCFFGIYLNTNDIVLKEFNVNTGRYDLKQEKSTGLVRKIINLD